MGTVNINVYGRDYAIACDDGQESHLDKLAGMVNSRVKDLLEQMGRAPEHTMLIYTALMLADELLDVTNSCKTLQAELKRQSASVSDHSQADTRIAEMEQAMTASMQQIAGRIEQLAGELEQAA